MHKRHRYSVGGGFMEILFLKKLYVSKIYFRRGANFGAEREGKPMSKSLNLTWKTIFSNFTKSYGIGRTRTTPITHFMSAIRNCAIFIRP